MSDRVSASISIGGNLPLSLHDQFVEAICYEGLSTEWDGPEFTADQIEHDRPLHLMAYDVAWGRFDELEQFCVDHGLAYQRDSCGFSGSFGAERIVFDGINGPLNYDTDDQNAVVLTRETIMQLGSMEAIAAYFADAEIVIPPLTFTD